MSIPGELQLVDRELTPRAQELHGLAMVVESQARLITSNSVLLQVIQRHPSRQGSGIRRRRAKGALGSLLGLFGIELRSAADSRSSARWRRWKR